MNLQVFIRCFLVGLAYAIASALTAALLGSMTRLAPSFENFAVWVITGTLVCLALTPFIRNSTRSRQNTIVATWIVLVLVRSVGLGIEGALFKPTPMTNAIVGALFGVLISSLIAWLSVHLLMPANPDALKNVGNPKSWWGWTWRTLVVGLSFFVFYFVFGATNALLYTQSFYANNPQYGLSLPQPGTIFLAQMIRGPLFGLAALFITRTVQRPRRQIAVWLGTLLFIVGGVAPYLETTFRTMPTGFNVATLTEIFLQNFLTGVVAAFLYVPKSKQKTDT
jgi:hypothetical protein